MGCIHEVYYLLWCMQRGGYTIDDVKAAVIASKSMASVLRLLGLKPVGGNYKTVKRIIDAHGIDTSHFTGQGWNVGLAFKPNEGMADTEVFVENSNYKCSWRLREKYKRHTGISWCQSCGYSEWLGKTIPLEIHHKNGITSDNRVDNLELLCPNCHALTEHYRGRAKKKYYLGFSTGRRRK